VRGGLIGERGPANSVWEQAGVSHTYFLVLAALGKATPFLMTLLPFIIQARCCSFRAHGLGAEDRQMQARDSHSE